MVNISKEGITITLPDFNSYEELYFLQTNMLAMIRGVTQGEIMEAETTALYYMTYLLEGMLLEPEQIEKVVGQSQLYTKWPQTMDKA